MTTELIAKCERCGSESTIQNPHDSCELCAETLCALCLANRRCSKSDAGTHKPAFFGMPTMTCPQCHMEMADFDGFGVLAHVAPMPGACGYCSHPNGDGDAQGNMICGICREIIPPSEGPARVTKPASRPPRTPLTVTCGDIVNLVDDRESAYVVVAMFANRVQLVYCGSERWYVPKWYEGNQILAPATVNKHSRRARRWLDKAGYDPDGWRRINCGRYGNEQRVTVDHVAMRTEATT